MRRMKREKLHLDEKIRGKCDDLDPKRRVLSRERDKRVGALESENRNMQNILAKCDEREEVRSVMLKGRMKRIIALESEKKSLLNALEKGKKFTFCISHL